MRKRFSMCSIAILLCALFLMTNASVYAANGTATLSHTLAAVVSPISPADISNPNDIDEIVKVIQAKNLPLVADCSLEAFIPELEGAAQLSLGAGGLGFLTGETWGGYAEFLKRFTGIGAMPLYDEFEGKKIDWDTEKGIQRVMVKTKKRGKSQGVTYKPFVLRVLQGGQEYEVPVYWINRKGAIVFLFRQPEMFRVLYPSRSGYEYRWEQDRQYGFFARCYVELMSTLQMSPAVVRLSEPQLLFVAVAMENDAASNKNTVFKNTRISMTTHTPEGAALPVWRGFDVGKLERLIGSDLVCPVINKDGIEWYVDAARELAKRAYIVNAVSEEHGEVTRQVILPEYAWKTVAIQNASDPDLWYSPNLATRVEQVGLENISGEELFKYGQEQKKLLNDYLVKLGSPGFSDLNKPLIGLVRRLVEYKAQGMLIPMIQWITGDSDKLYLVNGVKRPGLGANLLIGGKGNDDTGRYWSSVFVDLMEHHSLDGRFVFVETTGVEIRRLATRASDVWGAIPWTTREASGTSDECAALNGHWVIASATGGPLSYVQHRANGWLINPFRQWDFREVVGRFQMRDPHVIDIYYREGSKQLEEIFIEASDWYYRYVNEGDPRWINGMQKAFVDSHNEVAMRVMVPKYEALFQAIYDGSGAVGFLKAMDDMKNQTVSLDVNSAAMLKAA